MKAVYRFKEFIISNVGKLNKSDILSDRINEWIKEMEETHVNFRVWQFQYQTTETRHSVLIYYHYTELDENEKAYYSNNGMSYIINKEPIEPSCEIKITNGLDPETGEWGHNA